MPLRLVLPLLALLATLAYGLGLQGGFIFDDHANILQNVSVTTEDVSLDALVRSADSGASGPLGRPLAMASFQLNHATCGVRPLCWKLTNLAIHWVNAVLVFVLAGLLLRTPTLAGRVPDSVRASLPLFVAAVWAVHPLNLTSVLYIVQRMTSLSSLFMLAGLCGWLYFRLRLHAGERCAGRLLATLLASLTLALLAKESGVLMLLYVAVLELVLFRAAPSDLDRGRVPMNVWIGVTVLLPALATIAFLLLSPEWLASTYASRSFDLPSRLLTEARALWFYLGLLFLPRYREFGLYHDDFPVSTGLLEPLTTLPAVLGLVTLAVLALWRWRHWPWLALGVGWFLAGHALESTLIGLELVHEHRNYVAGIVPVFAVLGAIGCRLEQARRAGLFRGLAILFISVALLVCVIRSEHWSDPITLALSEAQYHPGSYRARYDLGRTRYGLFVYDGNLQTLEQADADFAEAARLDERNPLPIVARLQAGYAFGGEPDPALLPELRRRLALDGLHVSVSSVIGSLIACHLAEVCRMSEAQLMPVFDTLLDNPALQGAMRAATLQQLAAYQALVLGKPAAALTTMERLLAFNPERLETRLELAKLLATMGEFDRAQAQMDAAVGIVSKQRSPVSRRAGQLQIDEAGRYLEEVLVAVNRGMKARASASNGEETP